MNEENLNRYSLEQAMEEASKMESKLKSEKAGSYQEAQEQVSGEIKKRIEEELVIPATDEKRANYFFESWDITNYAERNNLPQDLIEEIHLMQITRMLQKLREAYSDYVKDPSEIKKRRLVYNIAGHSLSYAYFTLQKSIGYKDVAEAFLGCGSWRDAAFGTDETFGSSQHILAIEEVLNKYSDDDRFNKDPFYLKQEIAKKLSDLIKE
ncbi:MAG: hypothetical protein NUW00_05650 [Candidatus Kaiserbacteria bacterium]|nr:hypothetical protein [Candidatus Kaiserbacteria bacterium]